MPIGTVIPLEVLIGSSMLERNILRLRRDAVDVSITLPEELQYQLHKGNKEMPAGWYSPYFGHLIPTYTLAGDGKIGNEVNLVSVIRY